MIFIPPMEIATRIMTLIDNAKTSLVLVSPTSALINGISLKNVCKEPSIEALL
jgi:hypothetical protein